MATLSVADARAQFSRVVEAAQTTHERFEVTRNGSRVAVLLGADDFDALDASVSILGDADVMAALRVRRDGTEGGVSAAAVRAELGIESAAPEAKHEVRFAAAAVAALTQRLPRQVAVAALDFILGSLAADPGRLGLQLPEPLFPLYAARRGDYRVVYRLVGELVLVLVVTGVTRPSPGGVAAQ